MNFVLLCIIHCFVCVSMVSNVYAQLEMVVIVRIAFPDPSWGSGWELGTRL